jgi:hypothetical protein
VAKGLSRFPYIEPLPPDHPRDDKTADAAAGR